MLNNCGNLKCTATNNHHIDQIKNKPEDLLVKLTVQPGAQPGFY